MSDEFDMRFVIGMEEEEPPDGAPPVSFEAYELVSGSPTRFAVFVENDGDESSVMVLPVELLEAFLNALTDEQFD